MLVVLRCITPSDLILYTNRDINVRRHLADYLSATFNPPRHTCRRKQIVAAVVFSRNNDHHLGDGWKPCPLESRPRYYRNWLHSGPENGTELYRVNLNEVISDDNPSEKGSLPGQSRLLLYTRDARCQISIIRAIQTNYSFYMSFISCRYGRYIENSLMDAPDSFAISNAKMYMRNLFRVRRKQFVFCLQAEIEVVEQYSDPRDSKSRAYVEPGAESSLPTIYSRANRNYCRPYTGKSLSRHCSRDNTRI